ncbi:MAG: hypothetical protein ACRD8U_15355, partial [Pyrinomonadaceae bacterium]
EQVTRSVESHFHFPFTIHHYRPYDSLTVFNFMFPWTEYPLRPTTSTSKPGYDGRNLVAFQFSTVMSFSAAR